MNENAINLHGMCFHFSAAGVPISWILHSIYGGSYGICLDAAEHWYNRSFNDNTHPEEYEMAKDNPQYVCRLEMVDGKLKVVRSKLWMDMEYHSKHQHPEDQRFLCQFQSFPFEIPEDIQTLVTESLRQKLIEVGYFIPKAQWETNYPEELDSLEEFRKMMREFKE